VDVSYRVIRNDHPRKQDDRPDRNQDLPLPSVPGFTMTGGALNVDFAIWGVTFLVSFSVVLLILEHIYEGK